MKKNILVFESDSDVSRTWKEQMSFLENIQTKFSINENELKTYLDKNNIHILIINENNLNPKSIKIIKKVDKKPFFIILTNKNSKEIRYDFNDKKNIVFKTPIKLNKLFKKINEILKTKNQLLNERFKIKSLDFFPIERKIKSLIKNITLKLTEKETSILLELKKKEGVSISKDDLLKSIWGYNKNIKTFTLETHIYRLRKKLFEAFHGCEIIKTSKRGYKL